MPKTCTHTDQTDPKVQPKTDGCEEGLETGEKWVALRTCQTCGHVGCCDSSPGKHARAHHEKTGHPIIKPYPNAEEWTWCYIDDDYIQA